MDVIIKNLVQKFKSNDPFLIAEGLNIHVRYADLGDGTRGLYYRKLRRRFIVLDENLDYYWQRVVCAHEIGHDRLHTGMSGFWLDEQSFFNPGKYERQATRFSLKLLTYNETQEIDESIEWFLSRCGIPPELHKFYS